MSDHTGVNSAMLASMSKHGGESDHSSSHPVTQAQNVNTSWNKPVFENNLEPFPGAKTANLDFGGVSGSLDDHGIFALISGENSAFNQDVFGAFDGTIMSQGGVGHEGFNLTLSGDVSAAHSGVAGQLNMGDGLHITAKGGGGGQIQ
jgi:hypothetical protein